MPQCGLNILTFHPGAKTGEEVPSDPKGQKDPHFPKSTDCLTRPDGRALFVPDYYPPTVIFDPATKGGEVIYYFEGNTRWSESKRLPDNRLSVLVFSPFKRTSTERHHGRANDEKMPQTHGHGSCLRTNCAPEEIFDLQPSEPPPAERQGGCHAGRLPPSRRRD